MIFENKIKFSVFLFIVYFFLGINYVYPICKVTQISQYGVTWYFEKPTLAGKYITGDWWVKGPVKIVKVSPESGKVESDLTRITLNHWNDTSLSQDVTMRNGSMIVIKPSMFQGYDSRNQLYRKEESVVFPILLNIDQTLISTVSNDNLPVDNFCYELAPERDKKVKTILKSAAVLTCVSSIPAKDAFRPPYVGSVKPVFLSRHVNWKLLPKLKPTASLPSWELMESYLQRPWIDHILSWQQQEIVPNENGPNYGREYARLISIASVMVMLDVPKNQKERLTLELIQKGIDLYGIAMAGGYWNEGGGHSSGRKWPILFASIMLNDTSLVNLPATALFQEDTQTYYGKGWRGQKVLWQMIKHHGIRDTYEEKKPEEWQQWDYVSEGYRLCCTGSAWVGTALAARYLRAVKLWNHNAFFDYVDQWMSPNDTVKDTSKRPCEEGKAFDVFITEMWNAYRPYAPEQPKSNYNLKWVWKENEGKMIEN